jgi:hypothetical protein
MGMMIYNFSRPPILSSLLGGIKSKQKMAMYSDTFFKSSLSFGDQTFHMEQSYSQLDFGFGIVTGTQTLTSK